MNANISVTAPVQMAIERVKSLLFCPFDLGRWFTIGFCAWLAHLGDAGFHANFNFPSEHPSGADFHEEMERAKEFVMGNLYWIVPLAVGLIVFFIALGVALLWLNSRGKFMFLHCVASGKAEVTEPWRDFSRQGNSLFLFRLVLGVLAMIPMLPLVVMIVVEIYRMFARKSVDVADIAVTVVCALGLLAFGLVFAVIGKLLKDFVVPIMFLRRSGCVAAWREFLRLLGDNLGNFVVYLLFQIVLAMAIGMIILFVILLTCCCAGCLLLIPYLGTVLLLPVLAFQRAYSLCYLAQYGREYNVFAVDAGRVM